jgi:hypothetical protein
MTVIILFFTANIARCGCLSGPSNPRHEFVDRHGAAAVRVDLVRGV